MRSLGCPLEALKVSLGCPLDVPGMSPATPGAPALPGPLTLPPTLLSDHGPFCNNVVLKIKLHPAVISKGKPSTSCDQAGTAKDTEQDTPLGMGCGANRTPPIGISARAHLNSPLNTVLPSPEATHQAAPCSAQQQPQGQRWYPTQSFQNLTSC